MKPSEFDAFSALLNTTGEYYDKRLNETQVKVYWQALAPDCDLAQLRVAIKAHVNDPEAGRFMPKVADIRAKLINGDSRPMADEAWALLPLDESDTTVWSCEMAAAFVIARPLMADDMIAARMAFKAAYEREVREARAANRPAHWEVSLGWDKYKRRITVERALERGRITHEQARACLPSPEGDGPIAAMLEGKAPMLTGEVGEASEEATRQMRTLMETLRNSGSALERAKEKQREEREREEERRAELLAQAQARMTGSGK